MADYKNNRETLLALVLDESGSMESIKAATINGFNQYIASLRGNIKMTVVLFSSGKFSFLWENRPIGEMGKLNSESYKPNGGTPLYDAVARTISNLEDRADGRNVMLTIMTDGEENESKEYTKESINKLIRDKQEKGWVFTFLGANQDAWQSSHAMGIPMGNSINFNGTAVGTQQAFRVMAMSANVYASGMNTGNENMFNAKNVDDYELQAGQTSQSKASQVGQSQGATTKQNTSHNP